MGPEFEDLIPLVHSDNRTTTIYLVYIIISDIFLFVQWLLFKVLNLIIIDSPAFVLRLLSKNFEINLHLSSILATLIGVSVVTYLVIRYKFLTGYSHSNDQKEGAGKKGIHPASSKVFVGKSKQDKKPSNYLDEFLLAIKVFGYLDKAVFHELTKSMTTQKLSHEEILCLDESLGFLIVVEGVAQVYTKKSKENLLKYKQRYFEEIEEERDEFLILGDKQYQLLNEVKSGAPLSSLFSTLDLFRPRNKNEEMALTPNDEDGNSVVALNMDYLSKSEPATDSKLSNSDDDENGQDYPEIIVRPKKSHNNGTITIAIIPHTAFERVQLKYPKATSHIVTMVLTRLYKVTMSTVQNYLGLTSEILKLEIKLNEENATSLPRYFVDGLLERLNKKEEAEAEAENLPKKLKHHHRNQLQRTTSRYVSLDSKVKSNHAGDLLSSVPISRSEFQKKGSPKIFHHFIAGWG